ncbi:MAG: response regulator [Sinobacteraceae bacterium]|nr:response regulator [Nevskiaceae bacterium]
MARVMVVDDSPADTKKLKSILAKGGHDIMSAESGREAIELARSQQPDCIVMDVVMPDVNGFQATRALTKGPLTAHIPVIIVSAKDQPTDRLWATRQGAREYIVKPVKGSELLEKIDALLRD